ncbi:MAG: 30S ribosomal protein S12 methylthiotransferase RimO [Actinomycetota bacterium]|nr:30S ribosomal protein S12 methylthiotransferase RimO [Actinomycetota bacterium]
MSKRVAVITLGCAKNSVDSEHIRGSLLEKAIEVCEDPRYADYIIINTCGFIEAAKQESIDTILEAIALKDKNNLKKIIVTGCLAQRYYDELAREIPEVDMLAGIAGEWDIAAMIASDELASIAPNTVGRDFASYPARKLTGHPSAYLQVADGCDNWCAYCAIPLIRGRFKSKPLEKVLEEARMLDESGVVEVNLIAQDTGRYGYDLYGRLRLHDLLHALTGFSNIRWIRLLYLQPPHINEELIEAVRANQLIVPYLDIPFQHASPRILRAMNRTGEDSDFLAQIAWLRTAIPGVVLRSSVIVGFPGETENDFRQLADFVEQAQLDHLGIFEYSQEEGTAAASIAGHLSREIITERYHQLTALQDSIGEERNKEKIGRTVAVLVEAEIEPGLFEGRGYWQAPEIDGLIRFRTIAGAKVGAQTQTPTIGDIVPVTLDEFDGCDHHGRLISGPGK